MPVGSRRMTESGSKCAVVSVKLTSLTPSFRSSGTVSRTTAKF